ncbi:MAG: class I SAM-dependent methyltransferase [FCB group bacterium]|nr:class I SAM-dependent methyltransferase [FCB group bacterium]
MTLTQIYRKDFPTWEAYYRQYQYLLAEQYYLPLLKNWGISPKGKNILDVGCGDGGFITAFARQGAKCVGAEIREFPWQTEENLKFVIADITSAKAPDQLGKKFDLIILRDVIEHIPLDSKLNFLKALDRFGSADTRLLVTFPPFYSPFGLHQQTLLKSSARWFPYLGWLPAPVLKSVLRLAGETPAAISKALEIKNCRMAIGTFRKLLSQAGLVILEERYFTVRPSHEIRYGWRTRYSLFGKWPLIREISVLGTAYLLKFRRTQPDRP